MCSGHAMTFVRRDKAVCGQAAVNWFQCDAYRGMFGPSDDGRCTMTDARVVKNVTPYPLRKEAA